MKIESSTGIAVAAMAFAAKTGYNHLFPTGVAAGTRFANLASKAIRPINDQMPLPAAQILSAREIFPAALAEVCTPDPRTILSEIEKALYAGKPFKKLYVLDTPEGPVRLAVSIHYKGDVQVGFMHVGPGITFLSDGLHTELKHTFEHALRALGEAHGQRLRCVMSAGVPGGCGPIDQTVWS